MIHNETIILSEYSLHQVLLKNKINVNYSKLPLKIFVISYENIILVKVWLTRQIFINAYHQKHFGILFVVLVFRVSIFKKIKLIYFTISSIV